MPVSDTVILTVSSFVWAHCDESLPVETSIEMSPPSGVNLKALDNKLEIIFSILS